MKMDQKRHQLGMLFLSGVVVVLFCRLFFVTSHSTSVAAKQNDSNDATVMVKIEYVKALDCVDDTWLPWEDCESGADFMAVVHIAGTRFESYIIADNSEISPADWIFSKPISLSNELTQSVQVKIELWDADSDFSGGSDDEMDLDPDADNPLNLTINLHNCIDNASNAISGSFDMSQKCGEPITSHGGIGNPAAVKFQIAINDSTTDINTVSVTNEIGDSVSDAEVRLIRSGQLQESYMMNSNQKFVLHNLQPGDEVVAMQQLTNTLHSQWPYRLYLTSFDYDQDGNIVPCIVGSSTCRTAPIQLTIKKNSPLVLFDLIVSVGWETHGDLAAGDYLTKLENVFRAAQKHLFDTTDGQFAFGEIKIYDGGRMWNEAHIQIAPSNYVHPWANPGGITANSVYTYSNDAQKTTVFYPGVIRMGRTWNQFGAPDAPIEGEDVYEMLVHEFAHWAFMLFDEYFIIDEKTGMANQTRCYGSIMDQSYNASELDRQDGPSEIWEQSCTATQQYQIHNESAWETLAGVYTDTMVPPRWKFRLPPIGRDNLPKYGPNRLPFDLLQIEIVPPTQNYQLAHTTGNVKLAVNTPQGIPLRQAQVQIYTLRKTADDDWIIIEQGTTNQYGVIQLVGMHNNDLIYAISWDGRWSATALYDESEDNNGEINLALATSQWSPFIRVSALQDDEILIEVSSVRVDKGQLLVSLVPIGGTSLQTIQLLPDPQRPNTFSGKFKFADRQKFDEAHLWVREVYSGSDEIVESPSGQPYQTFTTYSLGGVPDSHKRSNPPGSPGSNDGYCQFNFPKKPWAEDLSAIVLPTRGIPPLRNNLRLVSSPCYLGTSIATFNDPVSLMIYYSKPVTEWLPLSQLKIYRLNDDNSWHVVDAERDALHYRMVAAVREPGFYVAAVTLPTRLALSRRAQTKGQFANVVVSPEPVLIVDAMKACSNYSIQALNEQGIQRYYDQTDQHVNSIDHFQPGETYYVSVDNDCVINLSIAKSPMAVSAAPIEVSHAYTVSMTMLPATFYGKIVWSDQAIPASTIVTASVADQPFAQTDITSQAGYSVFALDVLADNLNTPAVEGGQPNQLIRFQVGCATDQFTATWQPGQAQEMTWQLTTPVDCVPSSHTYLPWINR